MLPHDGAVHHPLGGGSYYFGKNLIKYLNDQCTRPQIAVHIGSQPNNSPHVGNTVTFATGFALAAAIKKEFQRDIKVKFLYVDSAPSLGKDVHIGGVRYQKSVKHTGDFRANEAAFMKVLEDMSSLSGVSYDIETQNFWRSNPAFGPILRDIVRRHKTLGAHMAPETGKLAIRATCPHEGCGLADKHGINNQYYDDSRITFVCPEHGEHHVDLTSPQDLDRLEFNTPLRNLIRILICSQDSNTSWIMCTGTDYAGFYQEQLTWRLLERPASAPVIFYAPLVLDWSGGKLSKSIYVKQGAYKYLRDSGRSYVLDTDAFLRNEGGVKALYEEVQDWVENPHKLFRNYSVEYLDTQLISRGMKIIENGSA